MKIYISKNTETLRYAAEELASYIERMCDLSAEITVGHGTDGITLGLLSDLGLPEEKGIDPFFDDVIDIKIDALRGYIAGSNERSVLFGVYDYLKSAGCRWVRPGADGEYIPKADLPHHSFTFRAKADFPYRGECIEGAVSYEHVRDMILWMPKVHMNHFMMEQVIPYNYMSRWYQHKVSTVKPNDGTTFEQVGEMVLALEKLIKKCGLQLHALGHGYLMEPYGIHYKTRDDHYELNEDAKREIALVDGKRELFHGSPCFTQLCMSQKIVRTRMARWLTDYMKKKPYIDVLHVWLADAAGNHCECEECRKTHPSDFYVMMLNELDAYLTEAGIDTKVAFIMYTDTLWAPEKEKFNNPSRFIMTTTPQRGWGVGNDPTRAPDLIPWKRNEPSFKGGYAQMLRFMDEWRKIFEGDMFFYEYYFYTPHLFDPGYMNITECVLNNIRTLDQVGAKGLMSDQTQRSFFPTGLPLSVLGDALFNKELDENAYTRDYMAGAFGEDSGKAEAYLRKVSDLFEPKTCTLVTSIVEQDTADGGKSSGDTTGIWGNERMAKKLTQVADAVDAFAPTVQKNLTLADPCHKKSWRLLEFHGEYCKKMSQFYLALTAKDTDLATKQKESIVDWVSRIEDEIHPQLDLVMLEQILRHTIKRYLKK